MEGKFLDNVGLGYVWKKLKAFFLPLTGGTIAGNLTVNGAMKRSVISGTPTDDDVPTVKWVKDNKDSEKIVNKAPSSPVNGSVYYNTSTNKFMGYAGGNWIDLGYTVGKFSSTADGLVPASGGGSDKYLRADGTWTTPPIGANGNTVTVSEIEPNSPKIGDIWI